jgi:hypothetical protein
MTNLTAAQYKVEVDNALNSYGANNFYNIERGMAWAQIASVYSHLWTHQALFDSKGEVPSALALGYRTKAEGYLATAKQRANEAGNTPASVAASQAASVAAYAYVQIVKTESVSP